MSVERRTRVRFLLAFWLFILSGLAFLDRTNISIAGLQISNEYGVGNQQLGWIFSAFLIGYAGFQLPAGWLAARFGPRRRHYSISDALDWAGFGWSPSFAIAAALAIVGAICRMTVHPERALDA